MRKAMGWTLVELLIVVVIIGILVAMLSSASANAKFSVRKAECAAYKRQLVLFYYMSEFETGEPSPSYTLRPLMDMTLLVTEKCYSCHASVP